MLISPLLTMLQRFILSSVSEKQKPLLSKNLDLNIVLYLSDLEGK